jgi:hypothetical protein
MRGRRKEGKDKQSHLLEQTVYLLNKEISPRYKVFACTQFLIEWEALKKLADDATFGIQPIAMQFIDLLLQKCFNLNGKLVDRGPHVVTNNVIINGQLIPGLHELCLVRRFHVSGGSKIKHHGNFYLVSRVWAFDLDTFPLLSEDVRHAFLHMYQHGKWHEVHLTFHIEKAHLSPPVREIYLDIVGMPSLTDAIEDLYHFSKSWCQNLQGIIFELVVPASYDKWLSPKKRGRKRNFI